MTKEVGDNAGVTVPPPLVYLGFLLVGPLLDRLLGWGKLNLGLPIALMIGALVAIAGLAIGLSALLRFRAAGTPPEPWKPSTIFVASGMYLHTRNPMYLGMALIMGGLGLMLRSPAALALVPAAMLAIDGFVIAREEKYLVRTFGDSYRAYRQRVRRWL